ncbi:hypothetical protein VN12_14825 [Pirellula sp. SH-Sr6A]|uniref:hypothetical protein n=1 Tax=Pirellula sp. SH-Sr6A TaxID=1632865 RepID=UPI00078CAF0A|nr:hypothetical protein [Pirellula sp. SH-Sr6A]AMV33397.1 hypothetical protein VN12_14825 [Pirellula sp. SH-Sr6A]
MLRRRIRSATVGGFVLGTLVAGSNHLQGQTGGGGSSDRPRLRTPSIPSDEPKPILLFGEDGSDDVPVAMPAESKGDRTPLLIGRPSNAPAPSAPEMANKKQNVAPIQPSAEQVPLIWQLANVAHIHASPFLVWLAPQTVDPVQTVPSKSVATGAVDSAIDSPTMAVLGEKSLAAETVAVEEPMDLEVDPGLPPVDLQRVEDVRELASVPSGIEPPANEEVPKRPRPVRIPLALSEIDAGAGAADGAEGPIQGTEESTAPAPIATGKRSITELDEERRQEEPAIDVPAAQNGKEDQGVDALLASKPGKHQREIVIDDPNRLGKEVPPVVAAPVLDATEAARLSKCNECLSFYLSHPESTSVRSPWAVMHALLAFGPDYELLHGNNRVNAIGWMCHNGTCRTQRMFTPRGRGFVPNVGAGVQGHEGQFLAILAQSNVPLDYPIQIGANKFKVEDLVRYEMATCKERSELTFKLIGFSYYLDSNKQWRANDGRIWSISKLIQEELAQPVVGAACGGTHRLMGFSFSVRQRSMQGQPINGQFARADQFVRNYVDYTWTLQNPDGSFSTSWYEGRGNEPNDERKVQTTGHMLEWLMYTLPDSEINQPRVQKSIDFLLSHIYDKKEHKWPIGPRGHATRAIGLYQARYQEILQSTPELLKSKGAMASKPRSPASRR